MIGTLGRYLDINVGASPVSVSTNTILASCSYNDTHSSVASDLGSTVPTVLSKLDKGLNELTCAVLVAAAQTASIGGEGRGMTSCCLNSSPSKSRA